MWRTTASVLVGETLVLLVLMIASGGAASPVDPQIPCPRGLSAPLTDVVEHSDGRVTSKNIIYPKHLVWRQDGQIFGCPCNFTRCLRICSPDYFRNETKDEDFPSEPEPFLLTIHHNKTHQEEVNSHEHFVTFYGSMCSKDYASPLDPKTYEEDEHVILSNGSLYYTHESRPDGERLEGPELTCLHYSQPDQNITVLTCLPPNENESKELHHYMYPVFLFISVFFLALTLLTYALSPEMRNMHGRSVATQSFCLLFGFFGLACVQLFTDATNDVSCLILAFITYFFLLASFFWLNVMSFDIWWTFRKMTGSLHQTRMKKILAYNIYAWSVPIALFIITICMDKSAGVPETFQPGIGMSKCWFKDRLTTFIYFNGPISILLAMNLYFFAATTITIVRLKREAAILKRGESRTHGSSENTQDNLRFKLYMRLFLVMGLSWVWEIIGWAVGGPDWLWYVFDVFNTLQGFFIFLICVWLTKSRDALLECLCTAKVARKLSFVNRNQQVPASASHATKSSDVDTHHNSTPLSLKNLKEQQLSNSE